MHSSSQTVAGEKSICSEQNSTDPDRLVPPSAGRSGPLILASVDQEYRYLSVSPSVEEVLGKKCTEFTRKKVAEQPLLPVNSTFLIEAIERAFVTQKEQYQQIDDPESGQTFRVNLLPQIYAENEVKTIAILIQCSHIPAGNIKAKCLDEFSLLAPNIFQDFFEQCPFGIVFVASDRKILSINPSLVKMWGYSREELRDRTILEITHPEDVQKSIEFMQKVDQLSNAFFTIEKRYICKDGHIMWGRVTTTPIRGETGNTLYHMTLVENIDQNIQTAQALETERLFMKYIMDSTFDSIYFKDLETRFVRVNRGTLNKFGLKTLEEITGKTDFDFFPKEIAEVNIAEEKNILETGIPLLDSEGIEMWPDDRPDTWVSSSKVPVRDQNDTLVGIFGISRDITDRKQKETEIRQLNLSLEKKVSERTKELLLKNKELEEFTYTVSHDLKAPLRGISGYSSLLLQEHAGQLDEEGKNFLSKLIYSAEQLSDLIDDLLAYSRLERREINYSNIALAEVVNILLDQSENEIQQKKVSVHLDMEDFKIFSSYDLLIQIIQNYLDNALKFTACRRTPEIWIEYKNHGATSLLSVRDNGIGFDNVYAEKIFEIFQRLNRADNYPGTGIGLALVKKAAQMLGYRVWGEGVLDEGAIFYLEINNKLHL